MNFLLKTQIMTLVLFAFAMLSPRASGATIVSVTGPSTNAYVLSTRPTGVVISEVNWTSLSSFSNVTISAEIGFVNSVVSAYLTTRIGSTETIANQIASTVVNTTSPDALRTLFTGLTLGPGTYYLVLTAGNTFSTEGAWYGTPSAVVQTAPGITLGQDSSAFEFAGSVYGVPNPANPPASTFLPVRNGFLYTISGDPASVPEPGSMFLMISAGFAGLCVFRNVKGKAGSAFSTSSTPRNSAAL